MFAPRPDHQMILSALVQIFGVSEEDMNKMRIRNIQVRYDTGVGFLGTALGM